MIANAGRIVARSTSARDGSDVQIVIEPGNPNDINRLRGKDRLTSGDTLASSAFHSKEIEWPARRVQPLIEQSENASSERNVFRISAQRIVDPDIKFR